jgi:hypothetical protein
MREHLTQRGLRLGLAVALVVVGACLALALVPHGVGGFGDDVVVTDPGPPPSVDAFRDDQRKRFRNKVANRVVQFVPVVVPVVGALAGFVVGSRRGDGFDGEWDRETAASVTVGAFAGAAVGYALFVGVASLAYAEVPGGYVLESYPPTIEAGGVLANAVGIAVPTALGAGLAATVAPAVEGATPAN